MAAILAAASLAGCSVTPETAPLTDENATEISGGTEQPSGLVNYMSAAELEASEQTELILLDDPWNDYLAPPAGSATDTDIDERYADIDFYNTVAIEIWTKDDYLAYADEYLEGDFRDQYIADVNSWPDDYRGVEGTIVNGEMYFDLFPPLDYDGGAGSTYSIHYFPATNENSYYDIEFSDYEECKHKIRSDLDLAVEEGCLTEEQADRKYEDLVLLYDSVIDGTVQLLASGTTMYYLYEQDSFRGNDTLTDSMYWEFDHDEVGSISESITEYHLWDEELDSRFVVHVTTPPSYDPSVSYPVMTLTDAVWRFGDVYSLYKDMEEGRADPAILITVGFFYDTDSWDNDVRSHVFCDKKKEFLDFLTDNMMPFIAERYNLDLSRSVLFGHSQGGVFSHYAAFNYDLYENRPFSSYIIGSPTFWTPYFTCVDDWADYQDEYGFWDRNDTYEASILITGGELEDEDYEEYYCGNESTIEGIQSLAGRLDSHGVTSYEVRLYDSHHYQYVPQMLLEYLEELL